MFNEEALRALGKRRCPLVLIYNCCDSYSPTHFDVKHSDNMFKDPEKWIFPIDLKQPCVNNWSYCKVNNVKYLYMHTITHACLSVYILEMEKEVHRTKAKIMFTHAESKYRDQMNIMNKKHLKNEVVYVFRVDLSILRTNFTNDEFEITIELENGDTKIEPVVENKCVLTKNMMKKLECPACSEVMRPPIFQCTVGHSICESCKANISECPVCHGGIEDARSFALEGLCNEFLYPCSYNDQGCNVLLEHDKIGTHLLQCKYKLYRCSICPTNHSYEDLKLHLFNEHHIGVYKDFEMKYDISNIVWSNNISNIVLDYQNSLFFICVYKFSDHFLFNTHICGPPVHYYYKVIFMNSSQPERKLSRMEESNGTITVPTECIESIDSLEKVILKCKIML